MSDKHDKVFFQLIEISMEFPEGFAIGLIKLEPITTGWVVGLKGAPTFEGEIGQIKAMEVAMQTSRMISGYRNGDVMLWDVIDVFKDENEAIQAARENEQMFIYQIETSELKWLS